jgi:hypothetical protein
MIENDLFKALADPTRRATPSWSANNGADVS